MPELSPKLSELSAAIEAREAAEARVVALRREVTAEDSPRQWSFSHDGIHDWAYEFLRASDFTTSVCTRAEVEDRLTEAVLALPVDRSFPRLGIQATASCALTNESVTIYVGIEQDQPACTSATHEWRTMLDENPVAGSQPLKRMLAEGCLHCGCRKESLWPDLRGTPDEVEVTYESMHYPEGVVRRMSVA